MKMGLPGSSKPEAAGPACRESHRANGCNRGAVPRGGSAPHFLAAPGG